MVGAAALGVGLWLTPDLRWDLHAGSTSVGPVVGGGADRPRPWSPGYADGVGCPVGLR